MEQLMRSNPLKLCYHLVHLISALSEILQLNSKLLSEGSWKGNADTLLLWQY